MNAFLENNSKKYDKSFKSQSAQSFKSGNARLCQTNAKTETDYAAKESKSMTMNTTICIFKVVTILGAFVEISHGFTTRPNGLSSAKKSSSLMVSSQAVDRDCKARELMRSLIEKEFCFSSESGAVTFGNVCSADCVYEDCYDPETPFVGKEVRPGF
jgi:hypothetical protein